MTKSVSQRVAEAGPMLPLAQRLDEIGELRMKVCVADLGGRHPPAPAWPIIVGDVDVAPA